MTVNIKLMARSDVMPSIFVDKYQSFGGIRCLTIQRRNTFSAS